MAWLLDVNVVLALMHERHAHAARAATWLDERDEAGCCRVCRVVQMGALRLLTHPAVMKDEVLSAADFWRGWDSLLGDERIAVASEPRDLERHWRERTHALTVGQSASTDAYLAAFARAGGWRLATFDRGLQLLAPAQVDLLA